MALEISDQFLILSTFCFFKRFFSEAGGDEWTQSHLHSDSRVAMVMGGRRTEMLVCEEVSE